MPDRPTQHPASNSEARKRAADLATPDWGSKSLRVTVEVDTDDLRHWADKHADAGHHGVAHVLYAAAKDGETLSEQVARERDEARAERDAAREALARVEALADEWERPGPKVQGSPEDAAAALRAALAQPATDEGAE